MKQPIDGAKKALLKHRLLKMQNQKCIKCTIGLTYKKSTLDHVIPISKTGSNDKTNFVILCSKCNNAKGNMIDIEIVTACKRMWALELGRDIKRSEQTTTNKRVKKAKKKSSGARIRNTIESIALKEIHDGIPK